MLDQLAENGVHADAILLDLGVSSMQIDRPERGFSYAADAPLDMRMDPTAELSAAELVNEASERELATIFRRYGEERYAKQIARAIGRRRKKQPIERTGDLVEIIRSAIPAPARFGDGHPAKRVFQALRIAVNDELGELEEALPAALDMLRPGGRLAVIAFHSLEDRIVKRFFQKLERGCVCPPDFPVCVCGREPELRRLNRKAIRPSSHELALNPRAASARLRAVQKAYTCPFQQYMLASGPRSRGARVHPRSCQGCKPCPRASAASGLVLTTRSAAASLEGALMARAAAARALPAPARTRTRARPKAARKPASRRRVAGGVVWIGVVGVLLAGVVALNVAVLRLNMQLDDVGRERTQLRAENAQLSTQIAARAASGRIVSIASDQLGLAPVTAENRTYLDLRR